MQAITDEMKIVTSMKSRNNIIRARTAKEAKIEPRIMSAVFFFACSGVIYGLDFVGNGHSVD